MKLQGMFVCAATPFDHTGAIYRAKVQHNYAKWRRTSVAGFIVGSDAGEGPLLSDDEKVELMKLAAASEGATPATLLGDVSHEGVHCAARLASALRGAGAHAVVSRPSSTNAALYFRALADRSPLPVVIHGSTSDIAAVAQHPNIVGAILSDAAGVAELRSLAGKEFSILAGTEAHVWESLKAGANGGALAFGSAAPYATIAIWEAFRTREEDAGIDWQARIAHPAQLVTEVFGPAGLKHAMDLNGYYGGPPRLPLMPLDSDARRRIEDAFRDLKG